MSKKTEIYKYTVELERLNNENYNEGIYYTLVIDGRVKKLNHHLVQFNTLEPLTFKEFKNKLKGTNGIVSYNGSFKPEYILTQVIPDGENNIKLEVSQDVIDFLDLHDIMWDNYSKYYKINNILYRLEK